MHVFELRYRMMMDDVVHSDVAEFGVVLIERGHEVGGGDVRCGVGTMARVVRHDELEDGRRAVVAVGDRRIRVERWLDDDPYPVAEVIEWPSPVTPIDPEVETRLDDAVERFVGLLRRVDERAPFLERRAPDETVDDYAYRVGSTLPIGAVDRQRIHEAGDAADRHGRARGAGEGRGAVGGVRRGDP